MNLSHDLVLFGRYFDVFFYDADFVYSGFPQAFQCRLVDRLVILALFLQVKLVLGIEPHLEVEDPGDLLNAAVV